MVLSTIDLQVLKKLSRVRKKKEKLIYEKDKKSR
jgi:hypothetical protein